MRVLLLSIFAGLLCAPCVASVAAQEHGGVSNHHPYVGHIKILRDKALYGQAINGSRFGLHTRPLVAVASHQIYQAISATMRNLPKSKEQSDNVLKFYGENFWRLEYLLKELKQELIGIGIDFDECHAEMLKMKKVFQELGVELRDPTMERFTDVSEGHWADAAIHNLRRAGILYGYPDGEFRS